MKTKLLTTLMFLGLFFTGELPGMLPGNYEAGKTAKSPDGQKALSPRLIPDHIVQKDEKGIIEWSSFSLPSNEKLIIEQRGKTSVTLIRVTGSLPSTLDGAIKVNGTLLLVNPNGIVIGESARITGGSIYISTEDIRDEDVQNGSYRFKGDSKMAIINNGLVEVSGAGHSPGTIAMMAGRLVNNGILRANGGLVQMIAKNPGGYSLSSIEHTGLAEAKTLPDGQKGEIYISAEGNMVEVTGRLDVSAPVYGSGGRIVVSGEYVKIDEYAVLSADGFNGGGEIFAGGSWMGCDPEIEKATGVFVAPSAILKANALKRGNGGTVVAYSDVINPKAVTRAYGTFEAYGGPEGGNGGNIETSGGWLDVSGSRGGASAPEGDAGTWLIDPYDITISSSTNNGSWSGGTFTPSGDNATISASDINALLNNGTSVTISTSGGGTQKGSISVSAAITKTSGNDVTLTLSADYRITIYAAISSTYNKLHFVADAGRTPIGDGNGRIGQFNVTSTGSISTNGGNITASGVNNSVTGGYWSGYTCTGSTCRGIQIDGNLNAGGGNISLTGLRRTGGLTRGVNITSTILTSGSGTITIIGQGNGDAYGLVTEGSAIIRAANGYISITGDSQNPDEKAGIMALAATTLETTGTGNVSLISSSGDLNFGYTTVISGGTTYLKATGYSVNLQDANNEMSGAVTVHSGNIVQINNKTSMTLGNVNATGPINIQTRTGNLTVTGTVTTSNTSTSAIKLIAEKNKNAGDGTGGNIIISGGSVSAAGTGRILLYTGSVSGSTGISGLTNYSSSRVYYNSDENSTLSPTPGAGLYVVYRGAGTPADPTSITASTNPICTGTSTQLTANGAVGTVYWYTGSCGGTLVTTGNPINVSPTTSTTYYARNYDNSLYSNGCASLLVTVEQTSVSGTLTKSPNQATVCEGSNVSATLTAGSGGSGVDSTYSRTQAAGAWSSWTAYTSGSNISTTGKTDVEIRTKRKGSKCSDGSWVSVSWSVEQTPVSGTLDKTPNTATVCEGTDVSATLNAGSGGNGIDEMQYSTYDGVNWTPEQTYTGGSTISTTGKTRVMIRTRRKAAVCLPSVFREYYWSVETTPVSGTLSKTPNQAMVCEGANVSVTLTSGNGGNGVDSTYSRTKSNSVWSSWTAYTSGTNISTTGKTDVEIRTKRKGTQCSDASWTTVSWGVEQTPVSGTLSKSPDVTHVCEGTEVSSVLTPGDGGNSTDIIQYRTRTGGNWTDWLIYAEENLITTDLSEVEIRTYRVANQCVDSEPNIVSWIVDPTTVGGTVSGGVEVCYGSNSTLLTLSGETGSVQRWQYSTDGTAWTDLASVTETTYTATDLTEATWFRAVVKSGVCAEENSDSSQITVFSDYHISGVAVYENNPKTPLGGLKIVLKKDGTPIGSPILTDNTGAYDFGNLTNGNYSLEISSAHPTGQWQTWSGVNNTDYLLVSKHIAGTQLLPVDPPVVRASASVKLPHPVINTLDATAIRQAAKFTLTGYNYFDTAKWVFSGIDATQSLTDITLNCADVTRDIRGLCAGDVNGTYVPAAGYKMADPGLELVHRGVLPITDAIIFPVRVDRDMELGAMTLYLDFDPSVMIVTNVTIVTDVTNVTNVTTATTVTTVTNVTSVTSVTSVTNSPDLWYNVSDPTLNLKPSTLNTLQIGWMSPEPMKVAEGQAVILIHARLRNPVQTHGRASLPLANPFRFTLNENPLSEFADGDGNVIDGLKLSIPDAGNADGPVQTHGRASLPVAITVYPNPAHETLNIELETLNPEPETLRLELVNLQGVVVITREPATITAGWYKDQLNLREIAPGVYFLRANLNGETVNKKIVITR